MESICLISLLTIHLVRFARLAGPEVVLVGNIPPRDVLAAGTPEEVDTAVRNAFGEITDHRPDNMVGWRRYAPGGKG